MTDSPKNLEEAKNFKYGGGIGSPIAPYNPDQCAKQVSRDEGHRRVSMATWTTCGKHRKIDIRTLK